MIAGRRLAVARHDAGAGPLVVFCHGFRGERTGPNRTFVAAARALALLGISSLRFDQYGSGDSEGKFLDSSFDDWVAAVRVLANQGHSDGRRIALFGQSMGASAAICAAASLPHLAALVAWVPDASIDTFTPSPTGYIEEGGQRVGNRFWREAHAARVPECFAQVTAPSYLVFGSADDYVSEDNRNALTLYAGAKDQIDVFDGYPHSAWTADQADDMISRSTRFLQAHLSGTS